VELTSLCNRDCVFCPRFGDRSGVRKDEDGKRTRVQMPTEKAHWIIDQAAELGYTGPIGFHRLSEAFLDPRYVDIATYAKEKGLYLRDNTNGDILRSKPDLVPRLDGVLDLLKIGLYDYTSWKERDADMKFWRAQFEKTTIEFSCPLDRPMIRQQADPEHLRAKDRRILDEPCVNRTRNLLIRYDGDISICCEDDAGTFDLGNAFEERIEDIWWSDKHVNILKDLSQPGGRHNYGLCSNCFKPRKGPNAWERTTKKAWDVSFRLGLVKPFLPPQKPKKTKALEDEGATVS